MTEGDETTDGWRESAGAWIADMGEHGDYGRQYVLDALMLSQALMRRPATALDVGCGEGRFCRRLASAGVRTVGVDPTPELLERARALDPGGDYRFGVGEALPVDDATFELVISYLTLIDIPDYRAAIVEMTRALRPGGSLLIANLTAFATAQVHRPEATAGGAMEIDHYLVERARWEAWRGIRVRNWHRPLSAYMAAFLEQGLILTFFDEPAPVGGDPDTAARYRRAPWYVVMNWLKPERPGP